MTIINKHMKKLLMLFAMIIALTACESKSGKLSHYENYKSTEKSEPRIKSVYHETGVNGSHEILEVEGHLYLSNYHGGIVHMGSCPCKTK